MQHGRPNSTSRHVGDLGNILSATSEGPTFIMLEDEPTNNSISLQINSISNILNRTIVIHEKADDFTGSSGNAGARIACGIIYESSIEFHSSESLINYVIIFE